MKLKEIFTTVALAVLLGCMIVFTTSCQHVNAFLETEEGQAIMDHGGVIAGVLVGSNNLDKIDEMVEICDDYLKAEHETAANLALEVAATYIFKNYGQTTENMIVMAEVQKLAGVFMKDGTLHFLDNYRPDLLGKFVLAFRNGASMATPRKTKFIRR